MTEQFTRDADIRYAFAPNPEPVEGILYRVHVLFEEPDGRLWSTGTDLMAAVKGGEKPDQRAEQNTATAAFGVRWSEGVAMRQGAVSAGNEGRA